MKKKLFTGTMCLLLAGLMTLSFGCAGGKNSSSSEPESSSSFDERTDPDTDFTDLSVREATGSNGVVASANAYASKAGIDVLEAGGNAFDASVAVAFALGIVEPYASGIGGGGVMTAYDAKTDSYKFYNFREFVPAAGTAAAFNAKGGKQALEMGATSAGVPTEVAGLCKIYEDLGAKGKDGKNKLSLTEVMQPAINYANNGFVIEDTLAGEIKDGAFGSYASADQAFDIYYDMGIDPFKKGDTLVQKDYGKVLTTIATEYDKGNGTDGFYKGWVADAIVDSMAENGGFITQADLDFAQKNYPKIGTPLSGTYGDYSVHTSNLPSSGGIILVETLNMLEHYKQKNKTTLTALGMNSTDYIHLVSTAMQLSYADKRKFIADNSISPEPGYVSPLTGTTAFANVPMEGLMNKQYAAQRFDTQFREDSAYTLTSSYDWGGAPKVTSGGTDYGKYGYVVDKSPWEYMPAVATASAQSFDEADEHWSTTSFSVADKEGNIVSYTQTINHFWGAYVIPEGCGFFLNNQLSSYSLTEGNVHYVQPYSQPVSHIMPTIIMKDGMPFATIGSPGSTRIPSAVIQVALNLMDFGMGMQEAIENPRMFSYCVSTADKGYSSSMAERKKLLELELVGNVTPATVAELAQKNYEVVTYAHEDLYFGGVQGIKFNYDKKGNIVSMTGGADIRRDGKALAI